MSLLELDQVRVVYETGRRRLEAVAGVDLRIDSGQTVGLVGESGSGKSTLARAAVGLVPLAGGRIVLDGVDVSRARARELSALRKRVQLVFQDPYSSLNPRMTAEETIGEALAQSGGTKRSGRRAEVRSLLELVGLSSDDASLYPLQFSGGQRQRIAIARALAVKPDLIIADEITSSLDVSIQAAILNLLRELQLQTGIAYLLISHNLGVVRYASSTVSVMHLGKVVESAPTPAIFASPRHPYTRALIDAIPRLGQRAGQTIKLEGDVPDPHDPPSGCRFHTRCPVGPLARPDRSICISDDPDFRVLENTHHSACHFPLDESQGSAGGVTRLLDR